MTESSSEMLEISITITSRLSAERVPELIETLRQLSVVPLALGVSVSGEQMTIPGVELAPDPERVTLAQFQHHYIRHLGADERASSLPTRVFHEVAAAVGPDGVEQDRQGEITAIKRSAFDELVAKNRVRGPISGEKTRRLLFGVAKDLPPLKV